LIEPLLNQKRTHRQIALTAAHVTDHAEGDGALFMSAVEGIEQMTGGLSSNPAPDHDSRSKDVGDMGYYHLSDDWRTKLHPASNPCRSMICCLLTN